MNKEEKIKTHLRKVEDILKGHRVCIPPRSYPPWRVRGIVSRVRRELVAIEALLQSRPETLASSVLRLTDLCNKLEKKNYELNLKLTQYRAGWCPYDCATREELAKLRAEIEQLKQEITKLKRHYETAKVLLDNKNQYINSLEKDFDAAARNNTSLRKLLQEKKDLLETLHQGLGAADQTIATLHESIVKQNKYIEILKEDRRTAFEQGYSVCRRGSK